MLDLLKPPQAIGLDWTATSFHLAEMELIQKKPQLKRLINVPLEEFPHVKQLYIDSFHSIATSLEPADVLIRQIELPLIKDRDIQSALSFQIEPLLPYPVEEAVLSSQLISQNQDHSKLLVFAAQKSFLQKHLSETPLNPDLIGCIQGALAEFGRLYFPSDKSFLIIHMQNYWTTGLFMQGNKLISSYNHPEGLHLIYEAHRQSPLVKDLPLENLDFQHPDWQNSPPLQEAIKKLQQGVTRIGFALAKDTPHSTIDGIILTGSINQFESISSVIVEPLKLPLLLESAFKTPDYSAAEQRLYGVSIGLASCALQNKEPNFRKHDFSHPNPWKRLKMPILSYFALSVCLAIVFYFFSTFYLKNHANQLKQAYVDLLTSINKPYEQFEKAFLAKNPIANEKFQGDVVNPVQLNEEDLIERLNFLQHDLQAIPDTFPLFANIPLVSDVLAWLSQHPNVVQVQGNGEIEPKIQIDNLSYVMVKRPVQGKKQEKYQVKVEIEFTSPIPTWAREFHDALIAPNDFVDSKGEIKWSANRGKYRTSFFLKDKTNYPG